MTAKSWQIVQPTEGEQVERLIPAKLQVVPSDKNAINENKNVDATQVPMHQQSCFIGSRCNPVCLRGL